jgi:hypothetical protein
MYESTKVMDQKRELRNMKKESKRIELRRCEQAEESCKSESNERIKDNKLEDIVKGDGRSAMTKSGGIEEGVRNGETSNTLDESEDTERRQCSRYRNSKRHDWRSGWL